MENNNPVSGVRYWIIAMILIFTLLGGYYAILKWDWSLLHQFDVSFLIFLLTMAFLYLIVNTLSTWFLLKSMGYKTSVGKLYLVLTASLSSNYITPVKAGIPIRLWLYKSLFGIPITSGSASLFVETGVGLIIGIAISILGAPLVFDGSLPRSFSISATVFLVIFMLIVLFVWRIRSLRKIGNWIMPQRYLGKIIDWLREFKHSFHSMPVTMIPPIVLLYFSRLTIRVVCLYFAFNKIIPSTYISPFELVVAQSMGGIIGIVSMLPMGIGAKDISLTMLLMRIGVPREAALVGVLIDRTLWTIIPLIAGVISANVLGVSRLAQHSHETLSKTPENLPSHKHKGS